MLPPFIVTLRYFFCTNKYSIFSIKYRKYRAVSGSRNAPEVLCVNEP